MNQEASPPTRNPDDPASDKSFEDVIARYHGEIQQYLTQVKNLLHPENVDDPSSLEPVARALSEAQSNLSNELPGELLRHVKSTHASLSNSLSMLLPVERLAHSLKECYKDQLRTGQLTLTERQELTAYLIFVNSALILMTDMSLKLTQLWRKSNELLVARVLDLPSLTQFRRRRLAQKMLIMLGFVGLVLGIVGFVPQLALPAGMFGLVWFFVDRYVLERKELRAIRANFRLVKEAESEVSRLTAQLRESAGWREESKRLVALWPNWIENRLLALNEGDQQPLIQRDTAKIAEISGQI